MLHKLPLLLSHQFSGTIWKVLPDSTGKRLVVEIRDDQSFKTTYSVIDLQQCTVVLDSISFPESWWIALAAFHDELILVQTFENKAGNPDRKNLIAFDVNSRKIRWETPMFSFFGFEAEKIAGYLYKIDLEKVILDPFTGTPEPYDWNLVDTSDVPGSILYLEDNRYFETIAGFITSKTQKMPVRGIEYQEVNGFIIMSFYVVEKERLANYLLINNNDGITVFFDRITNAVTGIGKDTFFTLLDCVFFVKNKSELVSYKLI